jgi:hypothetical protein
MTTRNDRKINKFKIPDKDFLCSEDSPEETKQIEKQFLQIKGNDKATLEDFKKISVIGRGGFGKVIPSFLIIKVFLVENTNSGEVLAMKVLNKSMLLKTKHVESTKTEKEILSSVKIRFV